MKKKNAFTLIELLAVILILGIIALIAIPTVTNIIKESKRGAFKSSVQNLIGAVETECQLEQMEGGELTTTYTFTNGTVDNELNIKGDLPESGTITVDSSCNVTLSVNNGDFCATKAVDSDSVLVGDIEGGNCVIDEDGNGGSVTGGTFATDDWATIVSKVKSGNISNYNVGDTKEIALTGFTNEEEGSNGLYTIRIANTSTPEECATEGYSQSACGFVIEFEDIITTHENYSGASNPDGWIESLMRTYINDSIYNALPTELKSNILDTMVLSSYIGIGVDENVLTTSEKIYPLSNPEVYGINEGDDVTLLTDADLLTRQLDYYINKGVTSSGYSNAIKKLNGNPEVWGLRGSQTMTYSGRFDTVGSDGSYSSALPSGKVGVAPAFRIG